MRKDKGWGFWFIDFLVCIAEAVVDTFTDCL